jgi:hypothetical protein
MSEQRTITVYTFDELEPKIKERVINKFRDTEDMPFLEDNLNELLIEKLDNHKILHNETLKLFYSLTNSQGDGVCFIGNFTYKHLTIKITHTSHYYYSKSVSITAYNNKTDEELDINDNDNDYKNKTYQQFKDIYLSICDELETAGYKEIDYATKEETIIDNIKANEYMFRANGEIE